MSAQNQTSNWISRRRFRKAWRARKVFCLAIACTFVTVFHSNLQAIDLPAEFRAMIASRKKIKSGDYRIRESAIRSRESEGNPSEFEGNTVDYRIIFDERNLRIDRSEIRPRNPKDQISWRFATTPTVSRVIPIFGRSVNDEVRLPMTEVPGGFASTIKNGTYDAKVLGIIPAQFSVHREYRLDWFDMFESVDRIDNVLETRDGNPHRVLTFFGGKIDHPVRYKLDLKNNLPTEIEVFEPGNMLVPLDRALTTWHLDPQSQLWVPKKFEYVRGKGAIADSAFLHETWTIETISLNQSIDSTLFEWKNLGLWKGALVRIVAKSQGKVGYQPGRTEWDGSKFVAYVPKVLSQRDLTEVSFTRSWRAWWGIPIGLALLGAALLVRIVQLRSRK